MSKCDKCGSMKPEKRGDCQNTPRPCIWPECRYHLIHEDNRFKDSWPSLKKAYYILEMEETCILDIADRGGETLEVVGNALGVTRERVRQIEANAIRKLKHSSRRKELVDFMDMLWGVKE